MADNYETNAGAGGKVFASDEDGGSVNWPYVKLVYGADNTQTLVSAANPVPVDLRTDNLAGSLDVTAGGDVAHGSADSGNPVKLGLVGRRSHPTAAANTFRVNGYGDDLGRLVNYPFAPRDLITHNRIVLTTTTETTLITAGGAGVFNDLVWLMLSNESATKVRVDIRDATAGTVRFSLTLAADGGGGVIGFPVPLTQAVVNNNWTAQLSAAVTSVYVHAIAVTNN